MTKTLWKPEGGGYFTTVPLSNGRVFHFGYAEIDWRPYKVPVYNVEMVAHDADFDWYADEDEIWWTEGESTGPGLSEVLPLALTLFGEMESRLSHQVCVAHVGSVSDRLRKIYRRFLIPRGYVWDGRYLHKGFGVTV